MALIHDMAESLVGDITPVDGVSKDEKNRRETVSMDYLTTHLLGKVERGGKEAGVEMREIWQEYEDNITMEAKFVHDVDKLELVLQMVEYEKRKGKLDLGEFAWVAQRIVLAEVREWCSEVLKEREQYWKDLRIEACGLDIGKAVMDHAEAEQTARVDSS
ncbi:hypothetical protein MMC26_006068 [Xylographa opegraphella]|nr:hypothetical protein [Xylographa opegraphella]